MKKCLFVLLVIPLLTFPAGMSSSEVSYRDGSGEKFRYHRLDEIFSSLLNIGERWELAYIINSTDVGVDGREIMAMVIGNGSSTLLVVGAHHGDEPVSAEIPLYFVEYLFREWEKGNTAVKHLLNTTRVVVVPVLNPFGLEEGIRWDEKGQDINRDYPYDPSPSEPHNDGIPLSTGGARFMDYLFRVFQPSIALSFHSGRRMLLYPWGSTVHDGPTPDDAIFRRVGEALSYVAGGVGGRMPLYEANNASGVSYLHGAWLDWAYASSWDIENVASSPLPSSTLSFTVEISTEKAPPQDQLGRWEEVEEFGGGYVSQGVRLCLKALDMTTPSVEVLSAERGHVKIRVHGDPSPGVPVITELSPDVKQLNANYTTENNLLGRVYNVTFGEEAERIRILILFGDYLQENTSARSLYYSERVSTTILTEPIHLPAPSTPHVSMEVVGETVAGGNATLRLLGVSNFTFIGGYLNISSESFNLSGGTNVRGNTITLPLPPRSGEGLLKVYIEVRGKILEMSTAVRILPALRLGGVPERIEAGGEIVITPYAYGDLPEDVIRVEVVGPEGFREVYNTTLYEPVNIRTPFVLGNMTIKAKSGNISVSYVIHLTSTLYLRCVNVDVVGDEVRIGPVFLSAPPPEAFSPGDVNVSAIIVNSVGLTVLTVNLTFNESLTPPGDDVFQKGVCGGFLGSAVLDRPGNYSVYVVISNPGVFKKTFCGTFSITSSGKLEGKGGLVHSPFPALTAGLLLALISFVALIVYHFFTLRRMER